MRRADRLFEIVQSMRGGRLRTADDLAEQLEVSRRTIYRDIVQLQATGVPIEGEAGIGYVLSSDYHIPPLTFTADEIAALVFGARVAQAWGGKDMARAAAEALVKIQSVLPDHLQGRIADAAVYAPDIVVDPALRPELDKWRNAIDGRHFADITYCSLNDETSVRTIRPLGLFFWGKVWTLLTWCEKRWDFRSFRVDRIMAGQVNTQCFPRTPGQELHDFMKRMDECEDEVVKRNRPS